MHVLKSYGWSIHQCSKGFLPRLFFSFCLGSRTDAYWGETKRYPFWTRLLPEAIESLFCPGSMRTEAIRYFFLIKFFAAQIWKSICSKPANAGPEPESFHPCNTKIKPLHPCNTTSHRIITPIPAMNANQNPPSMNHHCRSDEREPPLQAIIGATATNGKKTGRAHQEPWTQERCRFTTSVAVMVAFCSGGDLDGGSSSGARWQSRERCNHGGSRYRSGALFLRRSGGRRRSGSRRQLHRSQWLGFRVPIWFYAREEEDG